jgi:hypothetical protein
MTELRFADAETLDDLATFVARARSADADGAIRLQASGMTLAAYVGVLPGSGLLAEGAVIGLRAMPLAEGVDLDTTVPLAGITDRLARRDVKGGSTLPVPPTTVHASWAAVAPPRSGWEPLGSVPTEDLRVVALQGIQEIAEGAPEGSGSRAVATLRKAVWSREAPTRPPVMSGAAFAAHVLGFLGSAPVAQVFGNERWLRLSTPGGHVLVR